VEYQVQQIIEMADWDSDEMMDSLHRKTWFLYDKETIQACWHAIDALQNSAYDRLKRFFETHFEQTDTNDQIQALESIIIDQWENQQEVHLLC